jgi:hypothetical protein
MVHIKLVLTTRERLKMTAQCASASDEKKRLSLVTASHVTSDIQ